MAGVGIAFSLSRQPLCYSWQIPDPAYTVIYGQEVLYAARGQEARSRPAQAGIQWLRQAIPA